MDGDQPAGSWKKMIRTRWELNKELYRIALMAILLAVSCILTYYFHAVLRVGTVFTHFFYIPIILASLWWKKKGLVVAIFLSVLLIFSHLFLRDDVITFNDFLRSSMFIFISFVVALLREHITKAERESKRSSEARKQVEKALRESEEKYRTIFETTGTATIILEEDMTVSMINTEFEKYFGYLKKEVEGKKKWTEFIVKDDVDRIKEYHQLRRKDPHAAPRTYEFKLIDRKGVVRDILGTVAIIPGTKRSVASFLDNTERKRDEEALQRSEKQLRFLSSQLLTAQEDERKRIAQELHDGIGQMLSAIKFGVEDTLSLMNKRKVSLDAKPLETIVPIVQNGIEEVRRICMDLRPSILDDLGILATISWFCREFQSIYSGIKIEKQIGIKEDEIADSLKTVIYRLVQETFNNIVKHSKADLVFLSLKKTNGTIELKIKDNGIGFDSLEVLSGESHKRGLGLASMKERTELLGGSLSIESQTAGGTVIRASWPST
jgi:PAS domain S-box-containing protein